MREIKFRGKSLKNGEWVYGSYVNTTLQPYIITGTSLSGNIHPVNPGTVGQFTGVIDNEDTNNEVYEGDILLNPVMGDRWICRFEDGCFIVDLVGKDYDTCLGSVGLFEVIGNIYDNSNLLEME